MVHWAGRRLGGGCRHFCQSAFQAVDHRPTGLSLWLMSRPPTPRAGEVAAESESAGFIRRVHLSVVSASEAAEAKPSNPNFSPSPCFSSVSLWFLREPIKITRLWCAAQAHEKHKPPLQRSGGLYGLRCFQRFSRRQAYRFICSQAASMAGRSVSGTPRASRTVRAMSLLPSKTG